MKKSTSKGSGQTKATPKPSLLAKESLSRALDALKNSPRYEILRGLSASALIKDTKNDYTEIASFSLEDLVTLGTKELTTLKGLSTAHFQHIAEGIRLVASQPASPTAESQDPSSSATVSSPDFLKSKLSSSRTDGALDYRSSEAELTFLKLLQSARTHSFQDSDLSRRLADLWEPSWPSAPFEQQLTLKQLLDLDVEVILRKRSFTAIKLATLTKLVEKVLQLPEQSDRNGESEGALSRTSKQSSPHSETPRVHTLVGAEDLVSKAMASALWGFEEFLLQLPEEHPLHRIFIPLDKIISAPDLAALMSLDEEPTSPGSETAVLDVPLSAVSRRVKENDPALASSWTASLSGPGVHLSQLCEMVPPLQPGLLQKPGQASFSSPFVQAVTICIRALGATPVLFKNAPVAGYWSLNSAVFSMLAESLLPQLRSEPAKARSLLAKTFPLFKSSTLDTLASNLLE